MFCYNCGEENLRKGKFCAFCGVALDLPNLKMEKAEPVQPKERKSCPSCGNKDIGNGKFCPFCGSALDLPNFKIENPEPMQPQSENIADRDSFSMKITDTFMLRGKGLVLTGVVESGEISVNKEVNIQELGSERYIVAGLEKNSVLIQNAKKGDSIGVLVQGVNLEQKTDLVGKTLVSIKEDNNVPDYESIFRELAGQIPSAGDNQSRT